MTAISSLLGRWIFPPLCPVTGEETGATGTLSPAAWRDLAFLGDGPRCRFCGREVPGAPAADPQLVCESCQNAPRSWDRGRAALRYEGSGRALVMALKHGDRLDLAPQLAAWMIRAGPDLVAEADLIVPVPLHRWRLLRRRHNQSAEIARALARLGNRRQAYAPRLLRRVRSTVPQDGLGRDARAANLADALALAPGARSRLACRRVLLVDDVLTTGATLDACARVLRAGGAAGVDILVATLVHLARAPYVDPQSDDMGDPDE